MEKTTETTPSRPGNSGDWYLDLLGVEQAPALSPTSDAARSRTVEMSFVLEGDSQSASTPTPLEAPTGMPQPPSQAPSAANEQPGELLDWRPNGLAKQVESKRNFRWSIVVTLSIIVAIVIAAYLLLPATVDAEARDEAEAYGLVLSEMRSTLADTQQVLAAATEPSTLVTDLGPLTARLTRLDAAAGEVVARAARPLPDTLPLLSRAPLEELVPTRDTMQLLGETGTLIVLRISETISYRTTLEGLLIYPSLPDRADPSQINGLSVSLAETLAQSSAVVAELSLDPAFDAHRLDVAAAIETFEEWQILYLDSLRAGDQATAAALKLEAAELRNLTFASIVPSLATVRAEVDAEILRVESETTATIAAIPG